MVRHRLATAASLILALAGAGAASAGNLIVNGDFSAGDTGFSTDYTLTTMTPYLFQNGVHGIYAIEPAGSIAGSSAYGDWTNISTDPTGGNGNVFVADGATSPATVWSESVAVTPNTNYVFSYYGAEVSNPCCSNASFVPTIDGDTGPTLNATGSWQKSVFAWNSGSNTAATITLNDTNLSGPFNDFAVDDFSLTTSVPEPAAWAMMLIGLGATGVMARRSRRRTVSLRAAPAGP